MEWLWSVHVQLVGFIFMVQCTFFLVFVSFLLLYTISNMASVWSIGWLYGEHVLPSRIHFTWPHFHGSVYIVWFLWVVFYSILHCIIKRASVYSILKDCIVNMSCQAGFIWHEFFCSLDNVKFSWLCKLIRYYKQKIYYISCKQWLYGIHVWLARFIWH